MGAVAAAAVIAKEKHIVRAFRDAGITAADKAVAPASLGVDQRLAFQKLVGHGVLREGAAGTFYLDEAGRDALDTKRLRVRIVVLLALLLVGSFVGGLFGITW